MIRSPTVSSGGRFVTPSALANPCAWMALVRLDTHRNLGHAVRTVLARSGGIFRDDADWRDAHLITSPGSNMPDGARRKAASRLHRPAETVASESTCASFLFPVESAFPLCVRNWALSFSGFPIANSAGANVLRPRKQMQVSTLTENYERSHVLFPEEK